MVWVLNVIVEEFNYLIKYNYFTLFLNIFSSYSLIKLTVQPPHPAPVNLLPNAPFFVQMLVKRSMFSEEHSYNSLQDF